MRRRCVLELGYALPGIKGGDAASLSWLVSECGVVTNGVQLALDMSVAV